MNDDGLSAAANVHLCCAGDVQIPKVSLQLRVGCFQIKEGLQRHHCVYKGAREQPMHSCADPKPLSHIYTSKTPTKCVKVRCGSHLGYGLLKVIRLSPLVLCDLLPCRYHLGTERRCESNLQDLRISTQQQLVGQQYMTAVAMWMLHF